MEDATMFNALTSSVNNRYAITIHDSTGSITGHYNRVRGVSFDMESYRRDIHLYVEDEATGEMIEFDISIPFHGWIDVVSYNS